MPYTLLRNLDEQAIEHLTAFYNEHWNNGTPPQDWRHTEIILIPKPGNRYPSTIFNLYP